MAIVPKRKTSHARKNKRRAQWKLTIPNFSRCTQCGELNLPHRVCLSCGFYKGKDVLKLSSGDNA